MTKYLLGFFAIILALGLSAFTHTAVKQATLEESLYWYPVNQATNAIDHTALINASPLTKSQLRDNGDIPCPEAAGGAAQRPCEFRRRAAGKTR